MGNTETNMDEWYRNASLCNAKTLGKFERTGSRCPSSPVDVATVQRLMIEREDLWALLGQ